MSHCKLDSEWQSNAVGVLPYLFNNTPYYKAERQHSALGYLTLNHFETHFQTTSQLCAA